MKRLLAFLFVAAALSCVGLTGCKCTRAMEAAISTTVHDTVTKTVTFVERDTIIQAPAAAASVTASVADVVKPGAKLKLQSSNKQATATLSTNAAGDSITADCDCDSLGIAAKLRDQYTDERRSRTAMMVITKTKKHVPGVVKILAWMGGISGGAVLSYVGWRVFRPRIPIITA